MTSSCVHMGTPPPAPGHQDMATTSIQAVKQRSSKNLFKTALEKLNQKYKKHRKIRDNLYEVIVIYKGVEEEEAPDTVAGGAALTAARSEPCRRKARTLPTAPPRTRSRSQSRVSVRSADLSAPTPPPRSRRNSRASSSRHATLERPGATLTSSSTTCTFSSDTIPPTPPPRARSRPHSRSSARGGHQHEAAAPPPQLTDKRKPPFAPPRSPVVKERKIRRRMRDDDIKGILESVIALVSEADLVHADVEEEENRSDHEHAEAVTVGNNCVDYPPGVEALYAKVSHTEKNKSPKEPALNDNASENAFVNTENVDNKIVTNKDHADQKQREGPRLADVASRDSVEAGRQVSQHEAMAAHNARMDSLWDTVKHASNLSLNRAGGHNEELKETHIGGLGSDGESGLAPARSQSFSQLPHHTSHTAEEPCHGTLSPQDRIKRSLERLDLPDWYKDKEKEKEKERGCSPGPGQGWRQRAQERPGRARDRSLPPPSPLPSRARPHPAPRPVSPPSPCQQLRPYLGWRSQEKLPTFMEPGARLDTLDQACSDLLHTA